MNKHEFVIKYAEYIYSTAYRCYWKLKGQPRTEDDTDHICDIAVKIIESFSTKIDEGELNFKGDSSMTTYLYGAVFNSMREYLYGKQYFPKYVSEHGEIGRLLYNLRYLNHFTRKEALELVFQETSLSMKEIEKIDKIISGSMKSSVVNKHKGTDKKTIEQSQMDEFVSEVIFSNNKTPLCELLQGELRTKILSILDALKPVHKDIIRLKFIEEAELDLIQKSLGLKDAQAVYNQIHSARSAFVKESKRQNLESWIDFNLKGLNDERR